MRPASRYNIAEIGKPARASLMTDVKYAATVYAGQCRTGAATSTANRIAVVGQRAEML
jgi:hypothetical protein